MADQVETIQGGETRRVNQRGGKRLLILPKFQVPIIAINVGVMLIVSLVVWAGLERALGDLKPAAGLSEMEAEFYRNFLNHQAWIFRAYLVGALVAGAVISTILTLVISHRLAGPLVRMRGFFTSLTEARGEFHELTFRDGDYLGDLPPLINRALANARSSSDRKAASRD